MIAFYALGGGWGHFTRVKSFMEQEGIDSPIKVIVSNPKAITYFDKEELIIVPESAHNHAEQLQSFIIEVVASYKIKTWYIDTFPVGILGELRAEVFQGAEINFLARRLKWEQYLPLIKTPLSFEHVYRFEPLEELHQAYLKNHSEITYIINLTYRKADVETVHPILKADNPIWLVVHTNDLNELEVLVEHARDLAEVKQEDPVIVVLSDLKADFCDAHTLLSDENPQHWYGVVDRIFTAAGFNSWYELEPFRDKHIYLPFPRKYDDQFWRCQQV